METLVTRVTPSSRVYHPGPDRHELGRGGFLPHEVGSRAQGHGCPGEDAWLVPHTGVGGRGGLSLSHNTAEQGPGEQRAPGEST